MYAILCAAATLLFAAPAENNFDVVVYGGTPGGIATAITAARLGRSVALLEYHPHLGGMSASGLGKTDIETPEAIGGLFKEFVGRVREYYVKTYGPNHPNIKLCRNGYFYEPSVAAKIFAEMIAEQPQITVMTGQRLREVKRDGNMENAAVQAIVIEDRKSGERKTISGKVFVDGTYEGDLAAKAGADYRLGREDRRDFNELHAGTIYQSYKSNQILTGTTGQGDDRLQAYTFRLCLSTDPNNQVRLDSPPPDYQRERYLGYIDDWKSGRLDNVYRAFSIAPIPNNKTDVNMNPRPLGFPFTEENKGYPEADWEEREKITERIRNITLGLLYFLQNDPEVPEKQRAFINRYHLAKDEFTDNQNFPWQLYVREARRVKGEYVLNENDVTLGPKLGRPQLHRDSITAGEYPIDSFPVRKREPGHNVVLEGYLCMLKEWTHPYQIPFGVIVPQKVDGLLVPVPASTTHIAFSTIRLEPTWMALGQAAGTAAHLALEANVPVRDVDVDLLQRKLLAQGQVLTYFSDIKPDDPTREGVQYFGTKGLFGDYQARAQEPLTHDVARQWLEKILGARGAEAVNALGPAAGADSADKLLTHRQFAAILQQLAISPPEFVGEAETPVRRGEFCQILYEAHLPASPESK